MPYLEKLVRRILGRGRRRRYFVTPTVRTIRKLFERYPIRMNALCYGTLCASAELSQQTIKHYATTSKSSPISSKNNLTEKPIFKYDFSSVKRLAIWGTIIMPPIYHQWYQWLEKRFPPCSMTGVISKKFILKKTLFDQFIFTPPLLVLFFASMATLELASYAWKNNEKSILWSKIKSEVQTKFPPVYLADCAFWIPIQAFNFAYVPPTWRVLYIGLMSFVWLNVLCFARSMDTEDKK